MLIKVLGSAAGGGLPQWNCNGRNSADTRMGVAGLRARTQASVAVSANGSDWVVLNASPDLRQQINETPELQPATDKGPRNSPIKAVVLTNGDVDAIAGLLTLREAQPLTVYGSQRVLDVLASNSIFDVLDASLVTRSPMTLGRSFAVEGPQGPVGIEVEAFTVPGKVALYLEDTAKAGEGFGTQEGDTLGLKVTETGQTGTSSMCRTAPVSVTFRPALVAFSCPSSAWRYPRDRARASGLGNASISMPTRPLGPSTAKDGPTVIGLRVSRDASSTSKMLFEASTSKNFIP